MAESYVHKDLCNRRSSRRGVRFSAPLATDLAAQRALRIAQAVTCPHCPACCAIHERQVQSCDLSSVCGILIPRPPSLGRQSNDSTISTRQQQRVPVVAVPGARPLRRSRCNRGTVIRGRGKAAEAAGAGSQATSAVA